MAADFKSASLPRLSPSHKNGHDIQCKAYYRNMLQGMFEKMYQFEKGRSFSECEVEFVLALVMRRDCLRNSMSQFQSCFWPKGIFNHEIRG